MVSKLTLQAQLLAAGCLSVVAVTYAQMSLGAEKPKEPIVLQQAQYISTGNQLQQFATAINLQQNGRPLEKVTSIPLTLTFYNGTSNAPRFNWVRVFLSNQTVRNTGTSGAPLGRMLVSEANFRGGTNKVELNMTGALRPGLVIIVNGAGTKGSAVGWTVTTPPLDALQVSSLQPRDPRAGGSLTITGIGFSLTPAQNTVYFNQAKARVLQARADLLEVAVPPDLTPGKYSLQVVVNGIKSNPIAVVVKGLPELTRTDWFAGPSGATVTIYGKNFSEQADENNVLFGSERAKVISATAESLTVTVPMFPELNGATSYLNPTPVDITVSVGTTPAHGRLTFYSAKVGWQ